MSEEQGGRNGDLKNGTGGDDRAAAGYERLSRDAERRVLAGVCTGLARYTGVDPVVFRVGFALLVLAHGQGVFLYIAAVLLMPASPGESSLAEQFFKRWFDAAAVLTILGALLCAGVVFSIFGGATTDAIAVMVVFGLVLLVAHSRGVDLVAAARSVPERLSGHPPKPSAEWTRAEDITVGSVPLYRDTQAHEREQADVPPGAGAERLPDGMIDLAAYSALHSAAVDEASTDAPTASGKKPDKQDGCGSSPTATITLLAAVAAGAAMIPVANSYPAPDSWLLVMAPALGVIGLGLFLGGWLRTRGLAAAGTVLSLSMLTTSVASEVPRDARYGNVEWRPTSLAQIGDRYYVGLGHGTVDLTALPITGGQRVVINAELTVGGLKVKVPPTARVIVDAKLTMGDLQVGPRATSGPNAVSKEILEPDTPDDNPPVIDLRIRGKLGDVDVLRG